MKDLGLVAVVVVIFLVTLFMPNSAFGYEDQDVSWALTEASNRWGVPRSFLRCLAGFETGWTFDPYSVGDQGHSFGLFQLYDRGLLPVFHSWGYTDPFSPYQSSMFAAEYISLHGAGAWSPVKMGLC